MSDFNKRLYLKGCYSMKNNLLNSVYLSLGTNMGNREENLKTAVQLLNRNESISIEAVSSIYETAPIGFINQSSFFNIALFIQTNLNPMEMLDVCQSIENSLGRVRDIRWGPRIIDLDILLYNNENIETDRLTVPHPRMFERAFVLVPLLEIAEKPFNEKLLHARDALDRLNIEKEGVILWKKINQLNEFLT